MIANILMIVWVIICIVILILSIVNFFTLRKLKTQVNTGNTGNTGNISIGSGLISNSIVSVGTTWVDIPNTQPRGAYLILARGEDDEDSALVASVADNSDFKTGYIDVMALKVDATTNYFLELQYPSNSNVQIKMSNGNTRNVSILVLRA